MTSLKTGHWAPLALTLVVIVLLLLAPTKRDRSDATAELDNTEMSGPPRVENDIDSALEIISGEAPMQGILLLRKIADEHPENFRAQYNLGRFSAQTGQWDKVVERMEMVQRIDPDFVECEYWLGMAKFQLGQTPEAKIHLERYVASDQNNEQLKNEAVTTLNQIK